MDVLHGRILYSHDGLNTVQDGIYLTVSDTDHTVDIHVRLLVTAVARSSLLLDSDATLVITLPEGWYLPLGKVVCKVFGYDSV